MQTDFDVSSAAAAQMPATKTAALKPEMLSVMTGEVDTTDGGSSGSEAESGWSSSSEFAEPELLTRLQHLHRWRQQQKGQQQGQQQQGQKEQKMQKKQRPQKKVRIIAGHYFSSTPLSPIPGTPIAFVDVGGAVIAEGEDIMEAERELLTRRDEQPCEAASRTPARIMPPPPPSCPMVPILSAVPPPPAWDAVPPPPAWDAVPSPAWVAVPLPPAWDAVPPPPAWDALAAATPGVRSRSLSRSLVPLQGPEQPEQQPEQPEPGPLPPFSPTRQARQDVLNRARMERLPLKVRMPEGSAGMIFGTLDSGLPAKKRLPYWPDLAAPLAAAAEVVLQNLDSLKPAMKRPTEFLLEPACRFLTPEMIHRLSR